MLKQHIQFLNENLPSGWLPKAVKHFDGKYSKQKISDHKNGKVEKPDTEILTYLVKEAQANLKAKKKLARQMSSK